MQDNNLQNLKSLLAAMNGDHLSREEFVKHFQMVIDAIKAHKQDVSGAISRMEQTYGTILSKLQTGHASSLEELKKQTNQLFVQSHIDQMKAEHAQRMSAVDAKLKTIKNGRDGARGPQGLPGKSIVGATGKSENLKALLDRIDTLEKETKTLKQRPVGGGFIARGTVRAFDLNDYGPLNGVTKTFNTLAFWRIISITSNSFPGTFIEGKDYTWTGKSITFTSTVDAATTLAAGQSIWVTYVVG